MTGVFPANIGSYSNIKTIRLNNNEFTGGLLLDEFTNFDLKHLDVSENQLGGTISPLLNEFVHIGK